MPCSYARHGQRSRFLSETQPRHFTKTMKVSSGSLSFGSDGGTYTRSLRYNVILEMCPREVRIAGAFVTQLVTHWL